ncbi:GNAT family N-acetyltransferase [Microbacterium sp. 10M-3C3]|uniref:GNAT family N-acetyltransferase n=1 Tax=Microbacterium sp. 10M-3C3 TaxID=2483401 RepID=UPI001F0C8006|nr:GNAT family N-acetyltransferase [Microbacterium sp. 10M-3C3]
MEIEYDDDPARVDRAAVHRWLMTEAYWGRWRGEADIDAGIDGSWRVVGAYRRDTGALVGFARAVSDGVGFAYLADVFVDRSARGHGVGTGLVRTMIDERPGALFRWTLFTGDAHGLYAKFGFAAPDSTAMVRPAGDLRPRTATALASHEDVRPFGASPPP